ncbi:MAG: ATP-binding cassette domain-containing protein [Bacteroidetes bacterium]|nr:ATP-binding cassette domain-containing protein [Bacteroidota bacterium]
MSENILRALMQLFSLISEAEIEGAHVSRRNVVELFLRQQLNEELVQEYMQVFDDFLEAQQSTSKDGTKKKKRTSVTSVKVLRICTEINEELEQRQKVIVLIRLIEFIGSEEEIDWQELEFVNVVAETFNISKEVFDQCIAFVRNKIDELPDYPNLLVIDNDPNFTHENVKHIYAEELAGQIRILSIPIANIFTLRLYGSGEYYLNGQQIQTDKVYVLTHGSSIRGTKIHTIYYSDIVSRFMRYEAAEKIEFEVKNLEFKFKAGNYGLHDFTITEESGHMIGIMGGSGAGKSTLLNVLNGIESPSAGSVEINGINIHTQKDQAEGAVGFVPQDDLLMDDLTVYQNLFYAAKLCFGNLTDKDISEKCLGLLEDIGLFETRNLKVGNPLDKVISGGQRKRLNIALELVREPSVLFLDEPTSGLSSLDSENIMDLLKELALKGKLVFVVIHQPSSEIFKMFDKLIILDVGGYPIYFGNPVDAVIYFKKQAGHVNPNEAECYQCGNVNSEQIFNIIEAKIVDEYGNLTRTRKVLPKEWNDHYIEIIEANMLKKTMDSSGKIPESTYKIPSILKQFMVFVTRDVLTKLTNTQYMVINLLEAPLLAFILAYFVKYFRIDMSEYLYRYNENIPVFMFMSVVVVLFIGLTMSAEEIIKDQKILKREKFLNLSKGSYLFSKIFIMFTLSAIQTLSFILIGNYILEIKGMTLDYWIILFSSAAYANMLGLNISSAFNSAVTIYILIPFILIPQLLFSGVLVKFEKLNPSIIVYNSVPAIGELMVTRWAYEAMVVNQFTKNKYEREFYELDKIKSNSNFKKDFWISELRAKNDACLNNLGKPEMKEQFESDLKLLHDEIKSNRVKFKQLDKLTPETYTAEVSGETAIFLRKLTKYYLKKYNKAADKIDKMITEQTSTDEVKLAFNKVKYLHWNQALSELAINKLEFTKQIEVDGELIQQADPVFLDPKHHSNIRAHFFAPRKIFLGSYYDTFWVNMAVIWTYSFLFLITLYFNVFKKTLDFFENIPSLLRFGKK